MTVVLVALLGALVGGGVVLVIAGLNGVGSGRPRPRPRGFGRQGFPWLPAAFRRWGLRSVLGVVGGLVLAVATGWPVLAALVPLATVGLPILLAQPPNRDIELLQALDRWVRSLAAMIPTGRSITDAIRLSARQAPALLAEPLTLLVARLDDRWSPHQALFALADDLDSPDSDAVLAALALAAQRGGTGATSALGALADSIQDRLRALREIEAERAKPRAVVRQVTAITVSVLAAAMVFGREFFAPYGTPVGQVILAVLIALFIGSLVMLRRMTLPRRRERIVRGAA